MKPIDLEPRYSTTKIPGKCVKCLAEQELGNCLIALLREQGDNKELEEKFEALVSFLRSPKAKRLRDETERYLAEGKEVRLIIHPEGSKPRYEIKLG